MGNLHAGRIDHETCIAYYRNALPAQRAAQVRAYLDAHPDAADFAQTDATLDHAIAQSLDSVLQEPIPTRLQIDKHSAVRLWSSRFAIAVTIVLAAAVGWWFGDLPTAADNGNAFTQRVVAAAQRPPAETGTTVAEHLPGRVQSPDLSLQGYRLIRQQRLADASASLIEFVYRNDGGHLLRIYAETVSGQRSTPTVTSQDGVSLAQWRKDGTRYALVGDMPALSLQTLAQAAQADTLGDNALAEAEQLQPAQLPSDEHSITLQPASTKANNITPADGGSSLAIQQPTRM